MMPDECAVLFCEKISHRGNVSSGLRVVATLTSGERVRVGERGTVGYQRILEFETVDTTALEIVIPRFRGFVAPNGLAAVAACWLSF